MGACIDLCLCGILCHGAVDSDHVILQKEQSVDMPVIHIPFIILVSSSLCGTLCDIQNKMHQGDP